MPRRRIRWTNCRPIKLRKGALDVLVAALRITPTRLPVEAVTDEWWQAVMNNPRARPRSTRSRDPGVWTGIPSRPISTHREDTLVMVCPCGVRKVLSTAGLIASHGSQFGLVSLLNLHACKEVDPYANQYDRCRIGYESLTPI